MRALLAHTMRNQTVSRALRYCIVLKVKQIRAAGQGKARPGKARQGKARQGKARQGKARQGKARQGKPSP